jgi:hypothetical protein
MHDLCHLCENKTRRKQVECKVSNCTNMTLRADGICHSCATSRIKCMCGNSMNATDYMCSNCLNKKLNE